VPAPLDGHGDVPSRWQATVGHGRRSVADTRGPDPAPVPRDVGVQPADAATAAGPCVGIGVAQADDHRRSLSGKAARAPRLDPQLGHGTGTGVGLGQGPCGRPPRADRRWGVRLTGWAKPSTLQESRYKEDFMSLTRFVPVLPWLSRSQALGLTLTLLGIAFVSSLQAVEPVKDSEKQTEPITKGQRVFTCGHSFH